MKSQGRVEGERSRAEEGRLGGASEPGHRSLSWQERVALHSLSWLVVGNLVGMVLASLLLWPHLGHLLEPLTYGRWATVHHNLQLFGWCSLPLIGLLFRRFVGEARPYSVLARTGLAAWSSGLAFGAVSWLAGESSGKLFLEWRGAARFAFTAAMGLLALCLVAAWLRSSRGARGKAQSSWRCRRWLEAGALILLLVVPAVFFFASSPRFFPSINPHSGGATGTSLLGSNLGIVFLMASLPQLLGLASEKKESSRWWPWVIWLGLLGHLLIFVSQPHGDRSHHEPVQLLALASIFLWWPLLTRYFTRFRWPRSSRPWLVATAAWAALLLVDGFVAFLPGVLERWKFTNAMVAHAHLAMAGFVSSWLIVILQVLLAGTALRKIFEAPRAFIAWHGGGLAQVVVLTTLGVLEGEDPGLVPRGGWPVILAYGLRWLAGAWLVTASWHWLKSALESSGKSSSRKEEA